MLVGLLVVFSVLVVVGMFLFRLKRAAERSKFAVAPGSLTNLGGIVTGANTGIGKATAIELAKGGAHLVITCRTLETAKKTAKDITLVTGNSNIVPVEMELTDRESVYRAAQTIREGAVPLNFLINNAGVTPYEFKRATDGIETTWAVNHFHNFLFSRLLFKDLVRASRISGKPSRIVFVNSGSHKIATDLRKCISRDYYRDPNNFKVMLAMTYAETKLANLVTYFEFDRQLKEKDLLKYCTVTPVNPGPVNTDIARNAPSFLSWFVNILMKFTFRTPERGANGSVMAAVSPSLEGVSGVYFNDCKAESTSKVSQDVTFQKRMWELSCEELAIPSDLDPDANYSFDPASPSYQ